MGLDEPLQGLAEPPQVSRRRITRRPCLRLAPGSLRRVIVPTAVRVATELVVQVPAPLLIQLVEVRRGTRREQVRARRSPTAGTRSWSRASSSVTGVPGLAASRNIASSAGFSGATPDRF